MVDSDPPPADSRDAPTIAPAVAPAVVPAVVPARPADPAAERSGPLARRGVGALVSRRARLRGTVYLLLDRSTSMADDRKLEQLQRGALRFFAEAYERDYAVGAVAFGSRAELLSGASRDFWRFGRRLQRLEPGGRTAMAAAIRSASWRLRFRRGDRVMVLITDGMPNSREATLAAAAGARALGITLIAVGTDGADEAFLAALTPRPELASTVAPSAYADGIARAAEALGPGDADDG